MLFTNFSPFPELNTERLLLRQMTKSDAQSLFELRSNKDVMKYIARPIMQTMEDAEKWINVVTESLEKNEGITWCICLKNEPSRHLGSIGFWQIQKEHYRAEIGYMLHPSMHGKGIMLEAMQVVLPYGFKSMHLHSVEAHVDPENIASINLLLKAGFSREGYFKENYFFDGKFLDTAVYSLLHR